MTAKRVPIGSHAKAVTGSVRRTPNQHAAGEVKRGNTTKPTFELDDLDRKILLSHAEKFEVAERRLLRLGVAVDLDTEEVTLRVPVELALRFTSVSFGQSNHGMRSIS